MRRRYFHHRRIFSVAFFTASIATRFKVASFRHIDGVGNVTGNVVEFSTVIQLHGGLGFLQTDGIGMGRRAKNFLNMDIGIDWTRDTRDKGNHLNYSGAKKTTAELGKYLAENYTLPDRRNDEKISALWNADLENFKEKLAEQMK